MDKISYEQGFKEGFTKGHRDCLEMLIKILNDLNKNEKQQWKLNSKLKRLEAIAQMYFKWTHQKNKEKWDIKE